MCSLGYTVAASEPNTFWAADLMHRLYHVPAFGHEWIEHFASDYDAVPELSESDEVSSTRDSDTLQYFALEAYAYDIAVPGVGCAGEAEAPESSASGGAATTTAPPAAASTSATPTTSEPPSSVSIPAGCHTHGKDSACSRGLLCY
jgi:hypothetical protein